MTSGKCFDDTNRPRFSRTAQRVQKGYFARHSRTIGLSRKLQDVHHVQADLSMLKVLADVYHFARHAPTDKAVYLAYSRLIAETELQFKFAVEFGINFELFTGSPEQQPYSGDDAVDQLIQDIDSNRRVVVWPYAHLQPDHPLGQILPETDGWTAMNALRAVHDLLGHAPGGHQLSVTGEERAFCEHAQLYSYACRGALVSEFRGPLAWLCFGDHLRRPDGSLPEPNDDDYVPWQVRPYPEQKSTLLPDQFWHCAIDLD